MAGFETPNDNENDGECMAFGRQVMPEYFCGGPVWHQDRLWNQTAEGKTSGATGIGHALR